MALPLMGAHALLQEMERADLAAQAATALSEYQAATDADEVDLQLIVSLLGRLCSDPSLSLQSAGTATAALGAILVFLPGTSLCHARPLHRSDTVTPGGKVPVPGKFPLRLVQPSHVMSH